MIEREGRGRSKVLTALTTLVAPIVTACAVLIAAPVQAITFGMSDESDHPNVGAVLFDYDMLNPGPDTACSGTLIRNDTHAVFLTTAHCDPAYHGLPNDRVAVSFDSEVRPVRPTTKLYYGRFLRNPKHTNPNPDPYDIAVVVFDQPIPDITPAQLPAQTELDQMQVTGQLPQTYTVVGYGDTELQRNDGRRRSAVSGYASLDPVFMNLDQNHLHGYGGTCGHDSGGPAFLGSNGTEEKTVVAITYSGDLLCADTGQYYRLDTPPAREFLRTYVTLP